LNADSVISMTGYCRHPVRSIGVEVSVVAGIESLVDKETRLSRLTVSRHSGRSDWSVGLFFLCVMKMSVSVSVMVVSLIVQRRM